MRLNDAPAAGLELFTGISPTENGSEEVSRQALSYATAKKSLQHMREVLTASYRKAERLREAAPLLDGTAVALGEPERIVYGLIAKLRRERCPLTENFFPLE